MASEKTLQILEEIKGLTYGRNVDILVGAGLCPARRASTSQSAAVPLPVLLLPQRRRRPSLTSFSHPSVLRSST